MSSDLGDGRELRHAPIVESVERLAGEYGQQVRADSTWLHVTPAAAVLPAHGWKLHVSSRPSSFPDLVAKLVPALLAEGCAFKLARSPDMLGSLNDARDTPASVGKAFTVYPDPARVRDLGLRLVALLRGETGPRVLSDRRIDESAPVYYRYGPFTSGWSADSRGRIGVFLHGPGGERFEGEATLAYRQPSWATDPFAADRAARPVDESPLLSGGRYRVICGVYESARGNIFRAVDTGSGATVIVKQARAMVAESGDGVDARLRLRNERRVLEAAAGIPGVPRYLDHFQHGDDEFLVTSDVGPANLVDQLLEHGPYTERSVQALIGQLVPIVRALHERGIVMRDLAPKNIVLDDDGRLGLVDFGIAAYDGLHLPGATPGYAPARPAGHTPAPVDDLYALGMTLIHAMTGVSPVLLEEAAWSRTRALQTMQARYGCSPPAVVAVVTDLLSDDPDIVHAAFERLGRPRVSPASTELPAPPIVDDVLLAELTAYLLDEVLGLVDGMVRDAERARRPDASVYTGTAGIGLELLHHASHPDVPGRLTALADVTSRFADRAGLAPGLFLGRTGVELFLRSMRGDSMVPDLAVPLDDDDLISGSAGVGLGHRWLYDRYGDPRDLEAAWHCAAQVAGRELPTATLAHGMAGVVLLRLSMNQTPEADAVDRLAECASELTTSALAHRGDPLMTVSWCNGLTGIVRVLLLAARKLGRPDYLELAARAGDALASWVPRMESIGQCCGLAGIGDLFVDLAELPGGERFRQHASTTARQLLLRGAGPPERARLVNPAAENAAAWAGGLSGVLGFFRRLRDGGGPRLLPGL